jgi:branched-chain amino acid transport system permease protein
MLGMYLTYWFHSLTGLDPLWAILPVGAAMFLIGIATYRLILHRVVKASIFSQFFATFGLSIALRGLAQFLWSPDYRLITDSLLYGERFSLLTVTLGWPEAAAALGSLATILLLYLFVERTEMGRALQAAAQDRVAALVMGIDSDRMYALAWGIGIGAVGIAGVLLSLYFPIYPDVGVIFALTSYVVVTLGGLGSIIGTLLAGLIIQVYASLLISPSIRMMSVAVLFLIVVLVRPRGLLGDN